MPYSTDPPTADYTPAEELPQHLDHRPVYALPYEHFDGIYAGDTDTQYISVGLAQYNPDEVSIKAMRHTGNKWTRLAEELPLHRVIDMTLFLAKVVFDSRDGRVDMPIGTFLNQNAEVSVTQENRSYGEMASYNAFLAQHRQLLKDRLKALFEVLDELGRAGKI